MNEQTIRAVLLDTVSIQEYIFTSNKLKENLGASYLVQIVYKTHFLEIIQQAYPENDFKLDDWKEHPKDIFTQSKTFDIGYIGGGNALLLFREATDAESEQKAKEFVSEWTTRLLVHTPGISTAVAAVNTTKQEVLTNFSTLRERLELQLLDHRARVLPQTQLPRHGITTDCPRTGLSAEVIRELDDGEFTPLSSVAEAKLNPITLRQATEELQGEFHDILGEEYIFSNDLDYLGQRSGEDSHVAIVHIDGNDMGSMLQKIGSLEELRAFSRDIEAGTKEAFRDLLEEIVTQYNLLMTSLGWQPDAEDDDSQCPWGAFRLTEEFFNTLEEKKMPPELLAGLRGIQANLEKKAEPTIDTSSTLNTRLQQALGKDQAEKHWSQIFNALDKKKILPIRPIIRGGDDITFVCEGRLGIYFAERFIGAFRRQHKALNHDLTACAGIAIIKTKYPFSRGYALSEELCSHAKHIRRRNGDGASYLDFHASSGGIFGKLESLREKDFQRPQGSLMFRPFRVVSDTKPEKNSDGRNLDAFLVCSGKLEKAFPRGKREDLQRVVTLSAEATQQFMKESFYRDRTFPQLEGGDYHKTLFDRDPSKFTLTTSSLRHLEEEHIPAQIVEQLYELEHREFACEETFRAAVKKQIGDGNAAEYQERIVQHAYQYTTPYYDMIELLELYPEFGWKCQGGPHP